jgi:hypothetical protein
MSETGSTTGWGVGSSVHSSPTIQSHQTADFQAKSKQAVYVGIYAGIVLLFQSPVTIWSLSGRFEPPVSASKNSLPRGRAATAGYPWAALEFWEFLVPQRTFRARTLFTRAGLRRLAGFGARAWRKALQIPNGKSRNRLGWQPCIARCRSWMLTSA